MPEAPDVPASNDVGETAAGHPWKIIVPAAIVAVIAIVAIAVAILSKPPAPEPPDPSLETVNGSIESTLPDDPDAQPPSRETQEPQRNRGYVPLHWDASQASLVGRQGSAGLWGTCGECVIANTLNILTRSEYSEADLVNYVLEHGLCDPGSGGMDINQMALTYVDLLPSSYMDVYGWGGSYAPNIDTIAEWLDKGRFVNISVYGEMMREGGHTGEGEVYSTHWLALTGVHRNEDGSVAGFDIVDSASSATYIDADRLAEIYYGHDGTTILDPSVIMIYGWEYIDF